MLGLAGSGHPRLLADQQAVRDPPTEGSSYCTVSLGRPTTSKEARMNYSNVHNLSRHVSLAAVSSGRLGPPPIPVIEPHEVS